MDTDADCILLAVEDAPGIDSAAAFGKRYIVILRYQEFCVIAKFLEFCCDTTGDNSIVVVFTKFSVWRSFAGRELAVTVVDKDFPSAVVLHTAQRFRVQR